MVPVTVTLEWSGVAASAGPAVMVRATVAAKVAARANVLMARTLGRGRCPRRRERSVVARIRECPQKT
ncbi:hypothetical protein Ahu01nite_098430 [Winogradskya humida]|uniref:Uncharacterized protein n=1 Tax=Winogradskya humida TaxID=113566 RepID=A0ABQ4A799_9ACTN|nr:hypothetical protein Ahu01nite_098430 [Actinoplanes humidus]